MFAQSNISLNQNQPLSLVTNDEKLANQTDIYDDDDFNVVRKKLKRLILTLPQNAPYSIEQLAQLSSNVSMLLNYFNQDNSQDKDSLINIYRAIADPKNNAMNFQEYVNEKVQEYSYQSAKYILISALSAIAGIVSFAAICLFAVPTYACSTFGTFIPFGLFAGMCASGNMAKELIRAKDSLENIATITTVPKQKLGSLTDVNDGDSYEVVKYKLQRFIFNLSQNENTLYTIEQQKQLSYKITTLLTYFDQNNSNDQNKEILINIYRAVSDPKNNAQNFNSYVNAKAQEYSHKANKYSLISVLSYIATIVTFVASCVLVVPTGGLSLFGLGATVGFGAVGAHYSPVQKSKESINTAVDLQNIANITAAPKMG